MQLESGSNNLHRHKEMLSAGLAAVPIPCSISRRTHEKKTLVWETKKTQHGTLKLSPKHKAETLFLK